MRFYTYTPYPAHLFRGCIDEDRLLACAMVRATYDIVNGALRPAEAQAWPVSPGPWDGPHGPMPGDQRFVRGGVDVMIFGSARSPGGRAAHEMCGSRTLAVASLCPPPLGTLHARWRMNLHASGTSLVA